MDYAALYQKKLTSAAEAARSSRAATGSTYGWCTNHPVEAGQGLGRTSNELKDVKVRGGVMMGPLAQIARPRTPDSISPGTLGTAAALTAT